MTHGYWNGGDFGGVWIFWLGFVVLMLSSLWTRGRPSRADRKGLSRTDSRVLDIVNEMYASGKISRTERGRFEADVRNGASRAAAGGRLASGGPASDRGDRASRYLASRYWASR